LKIISGRNEHPEAPDVDFVAVEEGVRVEQTSAKDRKGGRGESQVSPKKVHAPRTTQSHQVT
jgi:hypothetical protein